MIPTSELRQLILRMLISRDFATGLPDANMESFIQLATRLYELRPDGMMDLDAIDRAVETAIVAIREMRK